MDKGSPPNIFFIVLDTVRAHNFGYQDYHRDTTPFLDSLAKSWRCYKKAFSPAPWTVSSHAALFTGTYESVHQTTHEQKRLHPKLPTLSEILSKRGYRTIAFSNNSHISPEFEFDRGFDTFEHNMADSYGEPFNNAVPTIPLGEEVADVPYPKKFLRAYNLVSDSNKSSIKTGLNWIYRRWWDGKLSGDDDRGASSTNDFVERTLESKGDEPLFMFLNYMEGHDPYKVPDDYQYMFCEEPCENNSWSDIESFYTESVKNQHQVLEELVNQYDGCLRYLDEKIRELISIIEEHNALEDSLIVITSDHGEAFGEHDLYGHTGGVYNPLVQVPLIIKPCSDIKSKTVKRPVSNRWLFASILRMLDIDLPAHTVDGDLFVERDIPVVVESERLQISSDILRESPLPPKFGSPMKALIHKSHKFIEFDSGTNELYAINDFEESKNLREGKIPEVFEHCLKDSLESVTKVPREDLDKKAEITQVTENRLRELGYID